MAERRMFAKTIVTSDAFLDMPPSTRCLYFTLGMFADDDGFVNNPKSIMRQIGASADDMNVLIAKKFVIAFDTGVIVIKHWRIHNYIQADRYHPTKYQDELSTLVLDENKAYSTLDTPCIQDVSKTDTEVRLGKDSLGKDRLGKDTPNANGASAEDELIAEKCFSRSLEKAVREWLGYKAEKKQSYKPLGLKSFLTEVKNNAEHYGEEAVIDVIQKSMAANYMGVTWSWLGRNNHGHSRFDEYDNGTDQDGIGETEGWDTIFGA